jgi:hypothetical protein
MKTTLPTHPYMETSRLLTLPLRIVLGGYAKQNVGLVVDLRNELPTRVYSICENFC